MTYNCPQLTQDLQALKEVFSVLKNQLAELETINSSPEVTRAEKIAKLKELYQIRKKLQEVYPPVDIMKAWADKYLATHKTSRRIAQTKEQALSGKYLIYLNSLDLDYLESGEGLKLPKIICGNLDLRCLTSAKHLKLPEAIGGTLDLYSLTSAEHLKLPDTVGCDLDLYNLTSAEHLKLPDTIGEDLDLRGLTSAEHLDLTHLKIDGYIYLNFFYRDKFDKLQKQYLNLRFIR